MCYYITATLPENTDIQSIKTILDKYNMAFSPINNSNVNSQLRPGELYFQATRDYCDCDTSLGVLNRDAEYQKLLNSKKVRILRKKKWTESKINGWIRKKLENKPSHSKRSITEKERHLDIRRWIDFILEIINSNNVSRIGILKHWYKYGLNDEQITIKNTIKSYIDEIKPDFLLNLKEDILYEFFPRYIF